MARPCRPTKAGASKRAAIAEHPAGINAARHDVARSRNLLLSALSIQKDIERRFGASLESESLRKLHKEYGRIVVELESDYEIALERYIFRISKALGISLKNPHSHSRNPKPPCLVRNPEILARDT
jgi:hypothetical protein